MRKSFFFEEDAKTFYVIDRGADVLSASFRCSKRLAETNAPAAAAPERDGTAGKKGCFGDGGGCGAIFKIDRATHAETILYRFTGGDDGGIPNGGLIYHDGALYGTTQLGGNRSHCRPYGCGTVFKLMLNEPK